MRSLAQSFVGVAHIGEGLPVLLLLLCLRDGDAGSGISGPRRIENWEWDASRKFAALIPLTCE